MKKIFLIIDFIYCICFSAAYIPEGAISRDPTLVWRKNNMYTNDNERLKQFHQLMSSPITALGKGEKEKKTSKLFGGALTEKYQKFSSALYKNESFA